MAQTLVDNLKLKFNEAGEMPEATTATSAEDGLAFDYTGREDGRILLILAGASTATVKAGNGLQGVEDLEVTIPSGGQAVLVVESGKYVNVFGENKGKVIVAGSGLTGIGIELP